MNDEFVLGRKELLAAGLVWDRLALFLPPFNRRYGPPGSVFQRTGVVEVTLVIGYWFGDLKIDEAIADGTVLKWTRLQ